jgi:hypothetical protein
MAPGRARVRGGRRLAVGSLGQGLGAFEELDEDDDDGGAAASGVATAASAVCSASSDADPQPASAGRAIARTPIARSC